jgi:biopolymer transport protein ExbB
MPTTATPTQLGFAHFIAQADGLAHFLLVVLLAMSVVTWISSSARASPTGA